MQRAIIVLALLLPQGAALAEEGEEPAFAVPVVAGDSRACGPQQIAVLRSRGDSVLSLLRKPAAGSQKDFVAVGPASREQEEAMCVIEVGLERPLEEPRTLGVDFRGLLSKEPGTTAVLTIELGPQRHVFVHAEGQLLEDSAPQLKRFQLALPAGARSVRIAVAGRAERINATDEARLGFDSLDLCFVDSEELEFCGAPGYPNPRARPQ